MNEWNLEKALAAGFPVKRVLLTATIMHTGWELDNEAWLVELDDGRKVALTTNHGGVCEMDIDEISEKYQETLSSAESINKLMASWPKE